MTTMQLTPHVTRYTAVILLAAALLVGAALALGHSGLLPYEGMVRYLIVGGPTAAHVQSVLDVARGLGEPLSLPRYYGPQSPDKRYALWVEGTEFFMVDTYSGARQPLPSYVSNVAWSPDGTRFVFTWSADGIASHRTVFLANADGSNAYRVTPEYFDIPRWSPDSRSILVTNNRQLYVLDAETGVQRWLTDAEHANYYEWSYDGSQIAFITSEAGTYSVKVINADGTNQNTLLRGDYSLAAWSPIRNELLVGVRVGSTTEIYIADLSTVPSQLRQITEAHSPYSENIQSWWWHPDGDRVFLMKLESPGQWGFVVVDSVSGQVELVTRHGSYLALSPDGEQVAFTTDFAYLQHELCVVTIAEGTSQRCIWLRAALAGDVVEWLP